MIKYNDLLDMSDIEISNLLLKLLKKNKKDYFEYQTLNYIKAYIINDYLKKHIDYDLSK